eukprot:CAMPEP_0202865230 /NCGR_PEP_ID=MMETSP1391-20130828/5395_1 /ASSEMBLY_ACC=CAM_ASM_000867 /TAXON_ID=1034604 /ORGANISM="Chlamydomonas leiostraca, Strain SAG 11-49" /LENGTH=443 /DNA_ID=CAMNT_0049545039 /DNA_START=93 /DNA_END=1424 /DNA_ORIENTATION=+
MLTASSARPLKATHYGASRRAPLLVRAVSTAPNLGSDGKSRAKDVQKSIDDTSPARKLGSSKVFVDNSGKAIKAMPVDYGFRAGAGRLYEEHYGEVPKNVLDLAGQNFRHELLAMRRSFRFNPYYEQVVPPTSPLGKLSWSAGKAAAGALGALDAKLEGAGVLPQLEPPPALTQEQGAEFDAIKAKLGSLRLSNDAVAAREAARVARMGPLESPWWVKAPFWALCWVLDVVYDNRPIQKFWVLETVARIPYFAYISILHLYESLGFWRAGAELRKIHFAEEWNELHHLQIMESLGGDQAWFDRFLAEHAAVFYYWVLIGFYLVSPKLAYNFMQRVEFHAADTYEEFLEENRDMLATLPPPMVALNYYRNQDLYLFDEFQTGSRGAEPRRPQCNNLLDVFVNIRDDELEHVKTMAACQDEGIARELARGRGSPVRELGPGEDGR